MLLPSHDDPQVADNSDLDVIVVPRSDPMATVSELRSITGVEIEEGRRS